MDLPLTDLIIRALNLLWTEGVNPFTGTADSLSPPLSPLEKNPHQTVCPKQKCPIFHAKLQAHISRLLSPKTMNIQTIVLALILISRLRLMNKSDAVRAGSEPHLLSTAFLVALKTLDDWRIDSVAWVSYSLLELKTIHTLEREFLAKIQLRWNVHVTRSEYIAFLAFMRHLRDGGRLDAAVFPIPKENSHHFSCRTKSKPTLQEAAAHRKLEPPTDRMPNVMNTSTNTVPTIVSRRVSFVAPAKTLPETIPCPFDSSLATRTMEQLRIARQRYLESVQPTENACPEDTLKRGGLRRYISHSLIHSNGTEVGSAKCSRIYAPKVFNKNG
ncbi:hypothetical protein CcCBS67573_g07618 [Chytriomyces confervae]|uniref:Cyclin N-terminal domain-containing protein n=1 Tax=Chytriomyces confervae TaxID=246404 RepID=A0A507ET46_9FUNG|nr:hypothetical protein CcCBS67573_g07618 [Chytriomyces confervae]